MPILMLAIISGPPRPRPSRYDRTTGVPARRIFPADGYSSDAASD